MKKKIKPSGRRRVGLAVTGGIVAIILIGFTIHFESIKSSYKKEIENTKKTYLSVSKEAEIIEKTKQQRVDFFKRRFYIDFPLKYAYSTANFFRKLSLISTQGIEFTEMETNPANQTYTFLLKGRIKARDKNTAQSRFREFYRKLEKFEEVLQITPATGSENTGPGGFYFTVNGEVEPE